MKTEVRTSVAVEHVLCVDLDGTLVATDLLWESLMSAIRARPWVLLQIPIWLIRGRSNLKRQLASASAVDFATLPYREATLAFLAGEHERGRQIVLATAADRELAEGVALHVGYFSDVLASDGHTNLKGAAKASALSARYGEGCFDYVGDSRADIPCWKAAADAIVVGAVPPGAASHVRQLPGTAGAWKTPWGMALRALRPHQWVKNTLLAVPAAASHRFDEATVTTLILAFISFSLCASGGYLLNDLLDLSADRRHSRKRRRPFASGRLSLPAGVLMIAACWLTGFGIAAWLLPAPFVAVTLLYLAGTGAYSIWLKREPVLDVMFLAGLYVIRVVAGGIAIGVQPSAWLLAFTLFVCLSLAFMKRYIEARSEGAATAAVVHGRGYQPNDAQWLQSTGLTAAYLSVVVLAIYVTSDDVSLLYRHPERLLLMCPVLLYWATRTWLDAHRRLLHDDPLVAVASDSKTYVLAVLSAAIVLISI